MSDIKIFIPVGVLLMLEILITDSVYTLCEVHRANNIANFFVS